ncbi:MAG: hypothetical protein WC758_01045 [Candidatus Woesearchaeota archaeon]|jgi:hypothetical protein
MADIVDYLLIAGVTYYVMGKVKNENDDGAKRMLIGVGTGLIAGYKGPELFNKFSNLNNTPDGQIMKDKLIAAGIAAGAGYLFGDKIIGSVKKYTSK